MAVRYCKCSGVNKYLKINLLCYVPQLNTGYCFDRLPISHHYKSIPVKPLTPQQYLQTVKKPTLSSLIRIQRLHFSVPRRHKLLTKLSAKLAHKPQEHFFVVKQIKQLSGWFVCCSAYLETLLHIVSDASLPWVAASTCSTKVRLTCQFSRWQVEAEPSLLILYLFF